MAKRHKNIETKNLSETIESSCFNTNQKHTYQKCIWTRENSFKNNNNKKNFDLFYPHGISEHGEFIFIGKTRSRLRTSNRITDQIGQVKKFNSKLEICHLNKTIELDSYVVLNFSNSSCYKWCLIDLNETNFNYPSNALRLGYDTITQSILYAGRTLINKNTSLIGRVSSSNSQLIVPIKSEINILNRYEILCLNPSVSSLKQLCRIKIRSMLKNENFNIQKLYFYLEPSLIKYVKIKNFLKSNDELRRGECIISKNGKYKLSVELDGRLVYFINENRDYLYLYENVDCLWFNELKLVVCFKNFKSISFLTNFDHVNTIYKDSKLLLCDDGNLNLICPNEKSKIVIRFRFDLLKYWNSKEPAYDFFYFLKENNEHIGNYDNDDDNDDGDEDESSDESNYSWNSSITSSSDSTESD